MSEMWAEGDLTELLGDPAGDNSTIKILRAKIKADNDAMKQMRNELNSMREMQRGNVVGEALKSAGLNPAAASLYTGEVEPTAVSAWVEANKGFIAPASATPPVPAGEPNPEQQAFAGAPAQGTAPAITPDTQAAYQRMITAGVDGVPGSNFNDLLGQLQNGSEADVLNLIAQYNT